MQPKNADVLWYFQTPFDQKLKTLILFKELSRSFASNRASWTNCYRTGIFQQRLTLFILKKQSGTKSPWKQVFLCSFFGQQSSIKWHPYKTSSNLNKPEEVEWCIADSSPRFWWYEATVNKSPWGNQGGVFFSTKKYSVASKEGAPQNKIIS